MERPTIHRRQFIIGPDPILRDGWGVRRVSDSMYLSQCDTLPVTEVCRGGGECSLILGLPVQTDPQRHSPAEEVSRATGNIESTYDSWAGRWIFLSPDELHGDISGLLGCYYTFVNGSLWMSSSVALLSEITNDKDRWPRGSELSRNMMKWYPLPISGHPSVRKLLPSQVLQLPSGEIRPRQLFPDEKLQLSESEALNVIQTSLETGLRWLANNGSAIWIALSAGYDSRLLLAAAIHAGVPVRTYTMRKENRWSNRVANTSLVSKADMLLPPIIARSVDVPHMWIDAEPLSQARLAAFDEHTYGQTVENDRVYYARGQWDWATDDDVMLLGQVMEVGSRYFHGKLDDAAGTPKRESIFRWFHLDGGSVHGRGIDDYVAWESHYSRVFREQVDWRDKFYLEQRVSGWAGALQQGLDLVQGERVHLINSQRSICAMLSLPAEARAEKRFVATLIDRMAPALNSTPYNPPDSGLYLLKKIAITLRRRSGRQIVRSVWRRLLERTQGRRAET
jgi:hypothetical protein